MQTIGTMLGNQVDYNPVEAKEFPLNSNIGIELELEGAERWPDVPGWRAIQDGSLRNGIEYVFNGPQGGAKAIKTIEAMQKSLSKYPPAPTFRCSTHIHLDVRDMTIPQLRRLFLAYCIFEDVMFDHCDPYRRYSNFCTPYFVNDSFIGRAKNCIFRKGDGHETALRRTGEFPKYSALNLQPVANFGSVEFRGSHAITKGNELINLAIRMMHLKRLALPEVESLGAYVEMLNKLRPQEAFPTGLKDGYVRDIKVADICYSNALLAATTNTPEPAVRHLLEGHIWDAPANMPPPPTNANGWMVPLDPEVFEEYGIAMPPENTIINVLRIIKAFQNIIGVRSPTLKMLMPDVDNPIMRPPIDMLEESFRIVNLRFSHNNLGFEI